jgi:hypothetical protein
VNGRMADDRVVGPLADVPAVVHGCRVDHQQRGESAALLDTRVVQRNGAVSRGRHETPLHECAVPAHIGVVEALRESHSAEAAIEHQPPRDRRDPRDLPPPHAPGTQVRSSPPPQSSSSPLRTPPLSFALTQQQPFTLSTNQQRVFHILWNSNGLAQFL